MEMGHFGIGFLDAVEKVQYRLTITGQLHFGRKIHIQIEIVTKCAVGVHQDIPLSWVGEKNKVESDEFRLQPKKRKNYPSAPLSGPISRTTVRVAPRGRRAHILHLQKMGLSEKLLNPPSSEIIKPFARVVLDN
jgi:hypothetical protein